MAKKTHYAVRKGEISGTVVTSWAECEKLVTGFAGAIYKGFTNENDAWRFINGKRPSWQKKPVKKDKYGFKKERYYQIDGIQFADFGRTVGINCDIDNLYCGSEAPWS